MSKRALMSVAMCTFNGARFLQEQLGSIASQSRLPDELVIFDDGSSDATITIIENFVKDPPFVVHFHTNTKNIGTTKNFEAAIRQCSGDLIVLADQDDVWEVEKLYCIEQAFLDSPEVGCVFSNADVTNLALHTLGYDLWSVVGFTADEMRKFAEGAGFSVLLRHNVVTGATMAFRSNLRDILLPIPLGWVHDQWIALVASAVSKVAAINKPLIRYRQHGNNQIGAVKKTFVDKSRRSKRRDFEREVLKCNELQNRLLNCDYSVIDQFFMNKIQEKMSHLAARIRLRESLCKGLFPGLRELLLLRYYQYSNGGISFIADVFYRVNCHDVEN